MKHIETIIASGTIAGTSSYESLQQFPGNSLKVREFEKGKCIGISLFVSSSLIGVGGTKVSINSLQLQRELNGLEYNSEYATQVLDFFEKNPPIFNSMEELRIKVLSSSADFWNVYFTVYYDDVKPDFKNRFISFSEFERLEKVCVVKTSPAISLTGSGNPVWKSLASFVQSYNGNSYYALAGGMSKHYLGAGFSPNVYSMILTGKFSGNRMFCIPMNCIDNPQEYTREYCLTVSKEFGDINSIPVIRGDEMPETMFEMYGDIGGADQMIGSLYLYELKGFKDENFKR